MVRNAVKSFVRKNKFHSYLTREILPVEGKVSVFDDHGKTPSNQTFADGPMRKVTLRRSSKVRVHGNFGQRGNYETWEYCGRMTSKNWRQFLIETLECVMMAVTNQSSSNKSEIDVLEENLENWSVENRYFSGYFDGKTDEFEDMLERFLLISSTFSIKKALNQRS